MLELQTDAVIMRFVAKNYKRIKKECVEAKQKSLISANSVHNTHKVNKYTQKIKKKQSTVEFRRKKSARAFEGRVVAALGCPPEKAKRAKKIIELLQQKKIAREVVLQIMRGQLSLRAALYGSGCVYLLSWCNLVKIGCTKLTAEARAKQIARCLPSDEREAELLGCIKTTDPSLLEKTLHEQYATKRIEGEWFALSGGDIAAIFSAFES